MSEVYRLEVALKYPSIITTIKDLQKILFKLSPNDKHKLVNIYQHLIQFQDLKSTLKHIDKLQGQEELRQIREVIPEQHLEAFFNAYQKQQTQHHLTF